MSRFRAFLLSSAGVALVTASAYAASSGSFTAAVDNANCTIDSGTGEISPAGQSFPIAFNPISVQISSGSGTALVVTPSAVTGLFTDNKLTNTISSSTQDVGIQVQVTVTPTNGTVVAPGAIQIAPSTPGDAGNGTDTGATCSLTAAQAAANAVTSCVIYDQRFNQISSQLLTQLANLNGFSTALEQIESTLSAHSFNLYVSAPGGSERMRWETGSDCETPGVHQSRQSRAAPGIRPAVAQRANRGCQMKSITPAETAVGERPELYLESGRGAAGLEGARRALLRFKLSIM